MRGFMNSKKARISIILAAVLAVGGGAAGAAIALTAASGRGEDVAASTPVQQIDQKLVSELGVLRRPRTSGDAMTGGNGQALAQLGGRAGVNLALSRKVRVGGTDVYVVPANGQVCVASPGAGSCADASTVAALDAVHYGRVPLEDPPDMIRFVGLVPDDVTAVKLALSDGSTADASLEENVFEAVVHQAPTAIVYERAGGAKRIPLNQQIMQTMLPPAGSPAAARLQREYQSVRASVTAHAR
jgi:hypothetical protein